MEQVEIKPNSQPCSRDAQSRRSGTPPPLPAAFPVPANPQQSEMMGAL